LELNVLRPLIAQFKSGSDGLNQLAFLGSDLGPNFPYASEPAGID
jgi:hypothetical protein